MFLREGSQLRAIALAVSYITAVICGGLGAAQAAGVGAAAGIGGSGALEAPREILPWRRDIERRAEAMLISARQSIQRGNETAAERTLRDLLDRYPRTYAASDGQRDLSDLRKSRLERRLASAGRRDLGIPPSAATTEAGPVGRLDPVAGWKTSVRREPSDMREALIEAAGDRVFFDEGSMTLSPMARAVLKKQARWLLENKRVAVRIVGHADDKGSPEANMRLSHDRAVAVRKHLIGFGVAAKRLQIFSHGRAQPIAICELSTCAAQNRRVVTEIRSTERAELAQ